MVTRELGRLDGIVQQIEGFAHPAAGVIDRADLSVIVQEAADEARTATATSDAQIKIQLDEGLPDWYGDRKAMTQCLQHLFVNSIEAAMRPEAAGVGPRAAHTPEGRSRDHRLQDHGRR